MFKFLTILVVSIAAFQANASLLIEPYGGYASGTQAKTYSATFATPSLQGTSDSGSINGIVYGGRGGFMLQHFLILAVDYQAISGTSKWTTAATSVNYNQHTLYATLGFQAPRGFRLMGSYGWDFEADEANTPNSTHYKGTSYKLTAGYHLPMHVAINVEYAIYKITDAASNGTTSKIADNFSKYDYSTVMATISFPFTFFHHLGGSGGGSGSDSGSGHSR